jgi:hypothetical protein
LNFSFLPFTDEVQHEIKQMMNSKSFEMVMIAASVYRPNLYLDVKFKQGLRGTVEDEIVAFLKQVLYTDDSNKAVSLTV